MDEQPEVVTPREARQGPRGRPILYVLLGGLTLGALYILGMMFFGEKSDFGKPPPGQGFLLERTVG